MSLHPYVRCTYKYYPLFGGNHPLHQHDVISYVLCRGKLRIRVKFYHKAICYISLLAGTLTQALLQERIVCHSERRCHIEWVFWLIGQRWSMFLLASVAHRAWEGCQHPLAPNHAEKRRADLAVSFRLYATGCSTGEASQTNPEDCPL